MDLQPQNIRLSGGGGQVLELGFTLGRIAQQAIAAGMELDHLGADRSGGLDLILGRFDEQADADAGVRQGLHHRGDAGLMTGDGQTALGRHFLATFRHQTGGVRRVAQGDGQHLLRHSHLEVQRLVRAAAQGRQHVDVGVGDVAAILAQMGGDAVGSGRQRRLGRAGRIRMSAAACVTNRGDVVDIDAQTNPLTLHPVLSSLL